MRKAVSQIIGGNVLSKTLGFARETFMAWLFGTGPAVAGFRIAQTCTLVPINFLTSDGLNSAFIPLYKQYRSRSVEAANTFVWSIATIFAGFSVCILLGLWFGAPDWVATLAPMLGHRAQNLAVEMLRVMGLSVPFYLLTALLNYLCMANGDFVPMASRASVQSVGLIAGSALAYLLDNAVWLAAGFSASYVVFGIWSLRRAVATDLLGPIRLTRVEFNSAVKAFWVVLRPVILLPVALQGNILVERAIAGLIGLDAISAVDYSRFITETLLYLVSVPVAFVGLATWTHLDEDALKTTLLGIADTILLVSIPAASFLFSNAEPLIEFVYSRGAFDSHSVTVTSAILWGASLGVWAQAVGYVLLKALNAKLRNGAVLITTLAAILSNVLVDVCLYQVLGATALGLGNSLYGLALAFFAWRRLGLSPSVIWTVAQLILGAAGYVVINHLLSEPSGSALGRLLVSLVVLLVWWCAWVMLLPRLRQVALSLARPPARTATAQ